MGLRLLGWNGIDHFACLWIDDLDGVGQLGGDVKPAVFRAEDRAMRPGRSAKINTADHRPRVQINDTDRSSIASRAANARVSVDRHPSGLPVGRYSYLVTSCASDGHRGQLIT